MSMLKSPRMQSERRGSGAGAGPRLRNSGTASPPRTKKKKKGRLKEQKKRRLKKTYRQKKAVQGWSAPRRNGADGIVYGEGAGSTFWGLPQISAAVAQNHEMSRGYHRPDREEKGSKSQKESGRAENPSRRGSDPRENGGSLTKS